MSENTGRMGSVEGTRRPRDDGIAGIGMRAIDVLAARATRGIARFTSRRSLLARAGVLIAGSAAMPLLPVLRASAAPAGVAGVDDPTRCEYWRNCGIDGYLCSCCGGSQSSCPPGTEPSHVTWIGTCRNPADGRDYVISYNDCCGKTPCGRCACNRNEGDRPVYTPAKANDILWCFGTQSQAYHCSVSRVISEAASAPPGG